MCLLHAKMDSRKDGLFRSHTHIIRIRHEMKIPLSKVTKLKVMVSRHLGEGINNKVSQEMVEGGGVRSSSLNMIYLVLQPLPLLLSDGRPPTKMIFF